MYALQATFVFHYHLLKGSDADADAACNEY